MLSWEGGLAPLLLVNDIDLLSANGGGKPTFPTREFTLLELLDFHSHQPKQRRQLESKLSTNTP